MYVFEHQHIYWDMLPGERRIDFKQVKYHYATDEAQALREFREMYSFITTTAPPGWTVDFLTKTDRFACVELTNLELGCCKTHTLHVRKHEQ